MAAAHESQHAESVEMPESTIWPLVLAVGVTLLGAGLATSWALVYVGAVLMLFGLVGWIGSLLPGRGHIHEELVGAELRPKTISGVTGTVAHLQPGMIGYRFRLPTNVHPISAGVKGGILGGLVMPIPAIVYGLMSGQGLWFPINLLAGMVLPGMESYTEEQLRQFNLGWLILAGIIHVTFAVGFGLMYGVILPTLPTFKGNWIYGAVLMPVLWSALAYVFMRLVNPLLDTYVDWPWFFVTQGVYGFVMSLVVDRNVQANVNPISAGIKGGIIAGIVMPIPAVIHALLSGQGPWFPINLLAGMVLPGMSETPVEQLRQFNLTWFLVALALHAAFAIGFGLLYGLAWPTLPKVQGNWLIYGAVLMPVIWSGMAYGFMGVVNPLLNKYVEWRWFFVTQGVFGLVMSWVVDQQEKIPVAPAGSGVEEPAFPEEPKP